MLSDGDTWSFRFLWVALQSSSNSDNCFARSLTWLARAACDVLAACNTLTASFGKLIASTSKANDKACQTVRNTHTCPGYRVSPSGVLSEHVQDFTQWRPLLPAPMHQALCRFLCSCAFCSDADLLVEPVQGLCSRPLKAAMRLTGLAGQRSSLHVVAHADHWVLSDVQICQQAATQQPMT